MEPKTGQICCSGKRNVLRFDLKESRDFCWRGRVQSFHVEREKTEKVQEPSSGKSGVRNLEGESI